MLRILACYSIFFFFNDTATTEIYTLSLHDALPIYPRSIALPGRVVWADLSEPPSHPLRSISEIERKGCDGGSDRKSTRLNSSHQIISYAVFCFKKKKKNENPKVISAKSVQASQQT